tara:strand:- start:418 stop:1725 length:1308 start_codon:yes stop_codon:yes gene_type:complete
MALKFADGSSGKRKDGVEIDSRYDNSATLIEPIAVELPCMTDTIGVYVHEVLALRVQLASASETLTKTKTTAAYIDSLRRRIDVMRTRAPPVRPLPFINDDQTECFFRCKSGKNACYLDSTLQILASMNALDCDAPPLWNDLQLDTARNISKLMRLIAEQIDGMRFPQTKLGLLMERSRLRDIDEELRESGVSGDALVVLDYILNMICAYRVHADEAITYAVKIRAGLDSVTDAHQRMLRVRIPQRAEGEQRLLRVTDVDDALRASGQFFVDKDDDSLILRPGTVFSGGLMYPAFDADSLIGERHTIILRVYDANPSTSFPFMLRPNTQIGTMNSKARTTTENLSQSNFYVLRSIAIKYETDGIDGVYSRFGSQWWRMTRNIEDVTRRLNPLNGKLPDDGASVCLLVYEMYGTRRTEGYYAPSGVFVSRIDDSLS